jgi:membrane-associated protease RseP (regulator of RpoE activity)
MKDVRKFYFTAIWYILWPLGIFCGHLVYFSRFGMLPKKNRATLCKTTVLADNKKHSTQANE